MSDLDAEFPPELLSSKETVEGLANRLKEFPGPRNETGQLILDILVHMLTDPIERIKLGPTGQFSEEEEAILQDMERNKRRPAE